MLLTEWQMAAHPAAALGLGAAIGLERQWRARLAGLRTNALVAGGAALFVLLSQCGFLGAAPEAGRAAGCARSAARTARCPAG
ncbi:MgtC/SapB family protein [Streptomyces sp. NPDC001549]|uniref:MgtC/SapB family protein n=1 Tax=Streptomyces sp. NPDC001549 TaxID=3364586 RepID=UPI003688D71B